MVLSFCTDSRSDPINCPIFSKVVKDRRLLI